MMTCPTYKRFQWICMWTGMTSFAITLLTQKQKIHLQRKVTNYDRCMPSNSLNAAAGQPLNS